MQEGPSRVVALRRPSLSQCRIAAGPGRRRVAHAARVAHAGRPSQSRPCGAGRRAPQPRDCQLASFGGSERLEPCERACTCCGGGPDGRRGVVGRFAAGREGGDDGMAQQVRGGSAGAA